MKTRQMFFLVAGLTVLLSHDVQAFYNTSTGRWLSRDPAEEKGGENLSAFVGNAPIDKLDKLGLCAAGCAVEEFKILLAYWKESRPWNYNLQLHVSFYLKLKPGSDPQDCRVSQWIRGKVTRTGVLEYFPRWTQNGPRWWWDGREWAAGRGMSSSGWQGLTVIFQDEPGFLNLASADYPFFWGGLQTPADFFDFDTQVIDYTVHPEFGGQTVARLNWGMCIAGDSHVNIAKRYYTQGGNGKY